MRHIAESKAAARDFMIIYRMPGISITQARRCRAFPLAALAALAALTTFFHNCSPE